MYFHLQFLENRPQNILNFVADYIILAACVVAFAAYEFVSLTVHSLHTRRVPAADDVNLSQNSVSV